MLRLTFLGLSHAMAPQYAGAPCALLSCRLDDRVLPVFLSNGEYKNVAAIVDKNAPAPDSPDFGAELVGALACRVNRLELYSGHDKSCQAKLYLFKENGDRITVRCSPAQGLVMALVHNAKIFASEDVLDYGNGLARQYGLPSQAGGKLPDQIVLNVNQGKKPGLVPTIRISLRTDDNNKLQIVEQTMTKEPNNPAPLHPKTLALENKDAKLAELLRTLEPETTQKM